MNNETPSPETPECSSGEKDVYTFQPFKLCLEYKTDVKKAVKYPNNFPMPRSGHRIVCNNQYIISYGGKFNSNTLLLHGLQYTHKTFIQGNNQ